MYYRLPACIQFTAKMAMIRIIGFQPVLFLFRRNTNNIKHSNDNGFHKPTTNLKDRLSSLSQWHGHPARDRNAAGFLIYIKSRRHFCRRQYFAYFNYLASSTAKNECGSKTDNSLKSPGRCIPPSGFIVSRIPIFSPALSDSPFFSFFGMRISPT